MSSSPPPPPPPPPLPRASPGGAVGKTPVCPPPPRTVNRTLGEDEQGLETNLVYPPPTLQLKRNENVPPPPPPPPVPVLKTAPPVMGVATSIPVKMVSSQDQGELDDRINKSSERRCSKGSSSVATGFDSSKHSDISSQESSSVCTDPLPGKSESPSSSTSTTPTKIVPEPSSIPVEKLTKRAITEEETPYTTPNAPLPFVESVQTSNSPSNEEVVYDNDVEWKGWLQKKTSKGLWVHRYFVATGAYLRYWHDFRLYTANEAPAESYSLSEVRIIEKVGPRQLSLQFSHNTKFRLEMSSQLTSERDDWYTVLDSKRRLFSTDELRSELAASAIMFATSFFSQLMPLSEKEQDEWIVNSLDDVFLASKDDKQAEALRENPCALLRAAITAVSDLQHTIVDCIEERKSREPRVIAHCTAFVCRYTSAVLSRTVLELMYLQGVDRGELLEMGESALCISLELCERLEALAAVPFLPSSLMVSVSRTLFSTGSVISAILNLCIRRVDAFFVAVTEQATARGRTKKLRDVPQLLFEFFHLIKNETSNHNTFTMLVQKTTQTILLSVVDHLQSYSLSGYEELALVEHISACDFILQQVSGVRFHIKKRTIHITRPVSVRQLSPQKEPERKATFDEESLEEGEMEISNSLLDALQTACESSAREAFLCSVALLAEGKDHLLTELFRENSDGWMGGIVCHALVNNFSQWADYMTSLVPVKFAAFVHAEVGRLLIVLYFRRLISLLRANRRLQFTSKAQSQIASDLDMIREWIHTKTHCDTTMVENTFLQFVIKGFLSGNDTPALLSTYVQSVRSFGLAYAWHLYDLLRLILKLRMEIAPRTRKATLAVCGEFVTQLSGAVTRNPELVMGELRLQAALRKDKLGNVSRSAVVIALSATPIPIRLFNELLPDVGTEHCTGSKWKVERPLELESTRLQVALLVTDTCNHALAMRCRPSSATISSSDANNSRYGSESVFISSPKDSTITTPPSVSPTLSPIDDISTHSVPLCTPPITTPPPIPPLESLPTAVSNISKQDIGVAISSTPSTPSSQTRPPPPPPPTKSVANTPPSRPVRNSISKTSTHVPPQPGTPQPGTPQPGTTIASRQPPPRPERRPSVTTSPMVSPTNLHEIPIAAATYVKPLSEQEALRILLREAQQRANH